MSEFEDSISILLLDGLTTLVHENDTSKWALQMLKQTFLTLSKIDTVHHKQRNLSALMQCLASLTENKNSSEIGEKADIICGLLQAMRHYGQFEQQLIAHPEWGQMILQLAAISKEVQPDEIKHKLLFELGLTLSLVPHPEILKEAYRIVHGKTWDHLTVDEEEALAYEMGGFELFTYKPTKHDLRQNISGRILDMLASQFQLEKEANHIYQKYLNAPDAYPDVQKYEQRLLKTPMHALRYMEPLYLPKQTPLFRGINARKGGGLLDEALFDLLKRGSGASELTQVSSQEGTWAKIGQMFTSLNSDYVMGSFFGEGGALMIINPVWVNEQIRIRQVRNEAESGAFHYVFYQTIPLEAMSEIYLPNEIFTKVHALYGMPKFTKANLLKAHITLPTNPAEERDLLLLYQAIKEKGKELIPKLKTYQSLEEVRRHIPQKGNFDKDVVPENVKRFIGRKLAKQILEKGLKAKL